MRVGLVGKGLAIIEVVIRRVLTVVGALLALFHLWLLASQAWGGELGDVTVIARWIVAGVLVAGLLHLQRRGHSLWLSRQAIALWVLAALLHGPALAARVSDPAANGLPEVVVTLTQTVSGLATLLSVVLIDVLGRRRVRPVLHLWGLVTRSRFIAAHDPDTGHPLSPRPPPATLFA